MMVKSSFCWHGVIPTKSWGECAAREVLEEMGLRVEGGRFGHVMTDPIVENDRHYVTIGMMCG